MLSAAEKMSFSGKKTIEISKVLFAKQNIYNHCHFDINVQAIITSVKSFWKSTFLFDLFYFISKIWLYAAHPFQMKERLMLNLTHGYIADGKYPPLY